MTMITEPQPTLHKPIPMNTRVRLPRYFSDPFRTPIFGTVVGISSIHEIQADPFIFTYIVLLDVPLTISYGVVKAVVVSGPELESEDGKTNWRLIFNDCNNNQGNNR